MINYIFVIALIYSLSLPTTVCGESHRYIQEGFALDKEGFAKVKDIHKNWYFFSIKALLGQIAKELLDSIDSASCLRLKLCLKRIVRTRDLRRTATCLLKAKEQWRKHVKFRQCHQRVWTNVTKLYFVSDFANIHMKMRKARRKRGHISASIRSKRSTGRLTLPMELSADYGKVRTMDRAPTIQQKSGTSLVHRLTNLFVSLFGESPADDLPKKWSTTYQTISRLSKVLDTNGDLPGARVYNARIYDIVVDDKQVKPHNRIHVPSYLKDAFAIVDSFSGAENARILSPRIAPLLPDRHTRGFLSPSVLPFYKDDSEQQILPVPKLLEYVGLNESDRQRVIEMVMEISGARKTVDKAIKVLHSLSAIGMDERLFAVTEKIGMAFEQLRTSLSRKQSKELDKRGFTFISPKQMEKLLQDQKVHVPAIQEQLNRYKSLHHRGKEKVLWDAIAQIAGRKRRRTKRQFQPIVVGEPYILAPYQFAPIFGFTLLGPVILSPNIFSPLILNPAALGPWFLSPAVAIPFILSPYVFAPYTLSPLAMAPFILTPYALSPNIMNPYLLSPIILSPLVLSPDLLSPMALGGPILSPAVLSPSVLSKSYLMANVLSPSLLS